MKYHLIILLTIISPYLFSQTQEEINQIDSLEQSFKYTTEAIILRNGIGTVKIPKGFKYLDAQQAEYVLTELWGNPKGTDMTLGFLLREDQKIFGENGYVFNIQYDEIGYVKDDDADDIDYSDLLETMQEEAEEVNKERVKQGYQPISIVGWASKPFYDKKRNILHWAKEIKFGNNDINTLNYNIRVLGRKGVLVLNAISTMDDIGYVKKDIHEVLEIVQFNEGYKYDNFNPELDDVAAWSIGGLVAGKVLAKVGFFALIVKFWKIGAIAVAGFFSVLWKRFKKKK